MGGVVDFGSRLGRKCKDSITGFQGIAVARDLWLSGCERYAIQASMKEDGTIPKLEWIDTHQLIFEEEKELREAKPSSGGPVPDPPMRSQDSY